MDLDNWHAARGAIPHPADRARLPWEQWLAGRNRRPRCQPALLRAARRAPQPSQTALPEALAPGYTCQPHRIPSCAACPGRAPPCSGARRRVRWGGPESALPRCRRKKCCKLPIRSKVRRRQRVQIMCTTPSRSGTSTRLCRHYRGRASPSSALGCGRMANAISLSATPMAIV